MRVMYEVKIFPAATFKEQKKPGELMSVLFYLLLQI